MAFFAILQYINIRTARQRISLRGHAQGRPKSRGRLEQDMRII
jgi:hypothetical protein